jgi:hypothetical protein
MVLGTRQGEQTGERARGKRAGDQAQKAARGNRERENNISNRGTRENSLESNI